MFIGHFGIAFAAKKAEPTLSLGILFLASQLMDLLWPLFLMLNIEKVIIQPGITVVTPLNFLYYPFTHSLFAAIGWASILAIIFLLLKKTTQGMFLIWFCVLSHWILDYITHRPDLPLDLHSSILVGLGLWNSLWATLLLEGTLFCIGIYFYLKTTKATNKKGYVWILVLGFISQFDLSRQYIWADSTRCCINCTGRSCPMAFGFMGVLGR